jgi:hypothetical protein
VRPPSEQLQRGYEQAGDLPRARELTSWLSQLEKPTANALRTFLFTDFLFHSVWITVPVCAAPKRTPPPSSSSSSSSSASGIQALQNAARALGAGPPPPLLSPDAARAVQRATQCAAERKWGQALTMARTAIQLAQAQEKAQNCTSGCLCLCQRVFA